MKRLIQIIMFMATVCICSAEIQTDNLKELKTTFFGGNLSDKISAVQKAAEMDDSVNEIFSDALNFVQDYSEILKSDQRMVNLVLEVIENSNRIKDSNNLRKTLSTLFYTYSDKSVKLAVINVMKNGKLEKSFMDSINEYALSSLANYSPDDEKSISELISALGTIKDMTSVRVLFDYASDENLPEALKKQAQDVLLSFSPGYKPEIISVLNAGTPKQKLVALRVVIKNNVDTDFFKAEIAEKALTNAIIYMGNSVIADNDILTLQREALSELRRVSWTRSAGVMINLFKVSEKEYLSGFIDESTFIEMMQGVVELASGEAGVLLSDYLAQINVKAENGEPYSSDLALAVIKMLGTLGDKVAFDSLLYVGYLPYNDNIIDAARIALAGLKW
ncbi:MAG: hypothetical protein K5751_09520 [Treponemataceae bacterium]|nr:hypothetical protein [Treponemataceae bacterium]